MTPINLSQPVLTAPYSTSETDVVIIGAGPAGLMAAQALARLGISVIVVERRSSPEDTYGNADGLQPRTLEIWQSYGLLNEISHRAVAVHALVTYDKKDEAGIKQGIPCENVVVGCRYRYELAVGIRIIEGTLRSEFERRGGHILQSAQPLKIFTEGLDGKMYCGIIVEIRPDKVALEDGERDTVDVQPLITRRLEYIRAKYVIGADGAHSWVRQHLGIKLEGEKTEHVWGAIDVWADTNFPDFRLKCIIQSPQGAVIIIPREEDKLHIYVQFPQVNKLSRVSSAASGEEVKKKLVNRIIESLYPYTIKFTRIFWYTIFSVPQKVASSFRVNSIFIIGDACHTHSPKAAQGANMSMGDAHNLAWKLAWLIEFDKAISASLDGCEASAYSSMLHQQNLFSSGVGIQYQSRLGVINSQTLSLSSLMVGARLPPGNITRVADWNTMDMQDLAPSDGLFKVLVFSGDLFDAKKHKALREFVGVFDSLKNISEIPEDNLQERFTIYTITTNHKETNIWDQLPPKLHNWKRVFTSTGIEPEDVYSRYGISDEGATLLIRPDGYISMILSVSEESARSFREFLVAL